MMIMNLLVYSLNHEMFIYFWRNELYYKLWSDLLLLHVEPRGGTESRFLVNSCSTAEEDASSGFDIRERESRDRRETVL